MMEILPVKVETGGVIWRKQMSLTFDYILYHVQLSIILLYV